MASIQHNVQQARATGDDKRLGMVASRKKVSMLQYFRKISPWVFTLVWLIEVRETWNGKDRRRQALQS